MKFGPYSSRFVRITSCCVTPAIWFRLPQGCDCIIDPRLALFSLALFLLWHRHVRAHREERNSKSEGRWAVRLAPAVEQKKIYSDMCARVALVTRWCLQPSRPPPVRLKKINLDSLTCLTRRNNFMSAFLWLNWRRVTKRAWCAKYRVGDWAGVQNTISEPKELRYMMTMLNNILI